MLGAGAFENLFKPLPARALQVVLRAPVAPPPPAEPLVKNTLDAEAEAPREVAPPAPPEPKPAPRPRTVAAEKKQVQAAQRKLAEHIYYPPEAIARNLEGEIRLILVLTEDGAIADVQIAASSGHAILDNAAIKAAWAMGLLPGASVRELILPVSFRLK
jgi:protein TonB